MSQISTGFIGFPDIKMRPVVIPDHFFTELLPQVDDLAELKLTLHCFWLLNEQESELRYLRGDDLRNDDKLLQSLTMTNDLRTAPTALDDALQRAVARNTLLKLEIETDEEVGSLGDRELGSPPDQQSKIRNPKSKIPAILRPMPLAKRLEAATFSFLLTGIEPLPREDAFLAIFAAMTADGHGEHCRRAFEFLLKEQDRPDPEKLREAILQTHLFAGYPRTLNALAAFKDACKKVSNPLSGEIKLRDEPLEGDDIAAFRQRGQKLFNLIYAENSPRIDRFARSNSPDLGEWAVVEGYGRVLSRPGLEYRQRSVCIVAALMPMDVTPQLKGHIQGALNTGTSNKALWALYELVSRLFRDGSEMNAAKATFTEVLGQSQISLDKFEEEKEWRE